MCGTVLAPVMKRVAMDARLAQAGATLDEHPCQREPALALACKMQPHLNRGMRSVAKFREFVV